MNPIQGSRLFLCLQPRRAAVLGLLFSAACAVTANAELRYYKVRAGDTLSKIAKAHGISYRQLACLNDITDPHRLLVGQRLALPRTRHEAHNLDLLWPVHRGWMSSRFGPRHGACHHGIDIAAPRGTAVRAAGEGRVIFSGTQNGYGKVVIVSHAGGAYHTLYAHLQRSYVKVGQRLRSGQRIAAVGSSGRSTGPHLHFELRENGEALDPMAFLPQKTQIVLNPKARHGTARGGN